MRRWLAMTVLVVAGVVEANPVDVSPYLRLWTEARDTGICSAPDSLARFLGVHGLQFLGGEAAVADGEEFARVAPVLARSQGPGCQVNAEVQALYRRWADPAARDTMIDALQGWFEQERPAVFLGPMHPIVDRNAVIGRQRALAAEALFHLEDPDLLAVLDRARARGDLGDDARRRLAWLEDRLTDPRAHRFLTIDAEGRLRPLNSPDDIVSVHLVSGDFDRHLKADEIDVLEQVPRSTIWDFWFHPRPPQAIHGDRYPHPRPIGLLVETSDGLLATIRPADGGTLVYRDDAWLLHDEAILFDWPSFLVTLTQVGRRPRDSSRP